MPQKETLEIERRVGISLAIGRYLRAQDRFNVASNEFTESCKSIRKHLGANKRCVVQVDFNHYLVKTDRFGNFEIESIEKI